MTRYARLIIVAAVAALVLAGCGMPLSPGQDAATAGSASTSLPSDEVRDVSRSASGSFTFETLLPVQLSLAVDLYGVDEDGMLLSTPLSSDAASVLVRLDAESGSTLYTGRLGDDATLDATVYLPAAPADIVLTLSASGFEERTVTIQEMVRYSRIERRMALQQTASATGAARSISGLVDSDSDGVPDVYDAFPNDPNAAFVQNVPADGNLTVAFEDLFGRANAGDADYNDFIGSYRIQEVSNAEGFITRIRVDASAVEKLAGYNHRFGIRIDEFADTANLEREYVDFHGVTRTQTMSGLTGPVEIELFENSATAVGKSAWFTLSFDTAQRQPDSPVQLSAPPYNPWVIVRNTGHDIHLIDREPLTELVVQSRNPDDRFVDADGFPWALLVPEDWVHPAEGTRIDSTEWYPRFTNWRLSGGEDFTDWYQYLGEPWVPPAVDPVVYVAGYYNDGTRNVAAYWVVPPDGTGPSRVDLAVPADSTGAQATDVYVDNGTVYVAGWYRDGTTRNTVAAFWTGGTRTDLTDPADVGRADAVTRDNGRTIVAVSISRVDGSGDTVLVWEDGVTRELYAGPRYAVANDVMVAGGITYVAGYANTGDQLFGTTYWADSSQNDLSGGLQSQGWALDISATGDVYVAGNYYNGLNYASAYWVNDASARTTLYSDTSTAGNSSIVTGIDETDGTVYAAGYYRAGSEIPAYWVDGERVDLGAGTLTGRARDVATHGASVFVAGNYVEADRRVAALWIDGTPNVLYDSGVARGNAEALSLALAVP